MRSLLILIDDVFQRVGYVVWRSGGEHDRRRGFARSAPSSPRKQAAAVGFVVLVGVAVVGLTLTQLGVGSGSQDKQAQPSSANAAPPAAPVVTATAANSAGPASVQVSVSRSGDFAWPANGEIRTYFGLYHPTGIDIDLDPRTEVQVRASASGVVSAVGGDPAVGIGKQVTIAQPDGTSTVYGALGSAWVGPGQQVQQGDVIGTGGSTGDEGGKHLHFEVRDISGPVDPLRYLPVAQATQAQGTATCPTSVIQVDPASEVTLEFGGQSLADYQVQDASVRVSNESYYPAISTKTVGPRTVQLSVPPAPSATGKTIAFQLQAGFRGDSQRLTVTCSLALSTRETLANAAPTPAPTSAPGSEDTPSAPDSVAGPEGVAAPLQPPGPTPTPTQIRPAIKTPTPKKTATPAGTQKPAASATPKK